ncbi:MAG: hypothetical protein Q8S33_13830 [Myxococcales bacterium]|nr:hypothetical protein [Myxococcales bacterium]
MKAKLFLLCVVALTGCPTTTPPVDCATKCAAVAMPVSICVDSQTVRDFALGLGDCSETCTFVPLDRACPGSCYQGQCVEALTPTDAGAETDAGVEHDAGTIDDGGVNACMNVTCAAPPSSTCLDDSRLRIFDARGVCAQGQCLYGSREEVCTAGCANGACQNNPCQGITCSTPPVAVCTDAATLKSFAPMGTCNNGGCRYAETLTTCQFGCMNGSCTNDPCAGVSCGQPPAPFCSNATTLRTFSTQGVCASGSCLYTPSDTTCRFGCVNGRCTNDPCQGVTCSTPPASACVNGTTLRTFTAAGVCSGGSCLYSPVDSTCQFGCAAGSCVGNPCQGVTCSQPPAATCVNPTTRRTFSTSGTCSGGACSYASTDTACAFGCQNGSCVGNPCQGVTCNMAPASTCVSATTLRTFSTSGTCSNGACSYASADAVCPFGCANGSCTGNPCQGVSCNLPPAPTCVNPTTLRIFSPAGSCSGGSCSYTAAESTCPFGCTNGACTGNPCQGVTCGMPPASTCLTPTTLRSFSSMGTCAGGACSYTPADTTCPFGCANGSCVNDPCAGVSCTMPPARTCLTPTTLRSFAPTGTCSGGGCSYTPTDMTCGFGCANGACANDPCAGVSCTTPPATSCVGSAVRTYSTSGTCTNGTCGYSFSDTACPGGCANGACQAPTCGGATCNTPPASTCLNANRLRTAFPLGTCTNSTCGYTQYEVLCSQGCINGACIAGSWTVEFMPQASPPVLITSETIFDATGEPLQVGCEQDGSFGSGSNGTVRFRRRTLSGWLEETVDVGMGPYCQARVVLDATGEPLVAWYDSVNNDLRFARRNGGTWTPKELVSTNGGTGLSLAMGAGGQPLVSYSAGADVQLGTRAANGAWTSEQVFNASATLTALRVVGGVPWVLANANRFQVASKAGATWVVSSFSTADGFTGTPYSFKPDSFTVVGGVPRAMISDGAGWMWRSLVTGKLLSEPISDEPLATRATDVPAIWISRTNGSGGQTAMIRVRQNDAWPDTLPTVPYATQLFRVVSYSGTGGRHVLMDATGRRLSSPPSACVPRCAARTCGDDGCGSTCGTCATGFCAVNGICAPLRSTLLSGLVPQRAAIAAGTTSMHVLESANGYALGWRSFSGSSFSDASSVPGANYGFTGSRFDVVNEQPWAFTSGSATSTTVPLTRSAAGVWSTGPARSSLGSLTLRFDAAGVGSAVRCTTSQVYLSTLAVGATAWTAETSIISFGASGVSCTEPAFSPSGHVYIVGVANNLPRLYSNAPGFTPVNLAPMPITSGLRMAADASGNLHIVTSPNFYLWRASTGTLETETSPADLYWYHPVHLAIDRAGATAVAFTRNGSRNLVLARRTGPSTWSTEELPSSEALSAAPLLGGTTEARGLAFDASNAPHILFNDRGAWRHVTK